jgi:hypothetical protein
MLPSRYERDKAEFWNAWRYQEMGGEGLEWPEEVTEEWWVQHVREWVTRWNELLDGWWVDKPRKDLPKEQQFDAKYEYDIRRYVYYALQHFEKNGMGRLTPPDPDTMAYTLQDVTEEMMKWNWDMCRMVFMLRHDLSPVPVRMNKGFMRIINQTSYRIAHLYKQFIHDTGNIREQIGLTHAKYVLKEEGLLGQIEFFGSSV